MKKFNLTSEKTMITEERLKAVLLPSFLSIILSVILLCGMTWAWFETTKAGSTEPIRTAEYGMTVTVSKGGVAEIGGDYGNGGKRYILAADIDYTVVLTATGTAKTGFCIMSFPAENAEGITVTKELYSAQMPSGSSITFTFRLTKATEVNFMPQWGTSARSEAPDIENGKTISVGSQSGSGNRTATPVTTEPTTTTTTPTVTEPVTTVPVVTEPVTTVPVTTVPVVTEPVTTTEPVTQEPVTTVPTVTEPVTTTTASATEAQTTVGE